MREEGRSHNPHFTDEKTELPKDLRTQDSLKIGSLKIDTSHHSAPNPWFGGSSSKSKLIYKSSGGRDQDDNIWASLAARW